MQSDVVHVSAHLVARSWPAHTHNRSHTLQTTQVDPHLSPPLSLSTLHAAHARKMSASASADVPTASAEQAADTAAAAASTPAPAAAASQPHEDQWTVNKPVERRCQALNEEQADCLACLWRWMTCGGPGARVRQLYINGRLSRCLDEYARLKNCMAAKLDAERGIDYLPGPHPVWRIRTRKQAAAFWREQYGWMMQDEGGGGGGNDGGGATIS